MTKKIENSGLRDFTIKCLTNRWSDEGRTADIIAELWASAKDLDSFKSAVLGDSRLRHTQAYAELSKETGGHWYRVREMFGSKCFYADADAGGVKVGNGTFSTRIGNGVGDGTTRIAVFAKSDDFNSHMMDFSGVTLSGEFSIYDHDCGNVPIVTLSGNYSVYVYDGLVAFVAI